MDNVYLGLTAIIGTILMCVGLSVLIPQGMWLYLVAVMYGTVVVTWSMIKLKEIA
jgi:L-asparagine transporter-like permease